MCLAWDQVYVLSINSGIFYSWLSISFLLIIVVLNSALNFGTFWFSKQPKMYKYSPQKRPFITQAFSTFSVNPNARYQTLNVIKITDFKTRSIIKIYKAWLINRWNNFHSILFFTGHCKMKRLCVKGVYFTYTYALCYT